MTATNRNRSFRHLNANRTGACSLLVLALSASAHAQNNAPDSERANLLFKKGKIAFNEGKYTDALRIYSDAWALKQSPDIAANLAQTESELGKHRDAAEHFAFALAHLLPSTTDDQKRSLAEGLEIEKREVGTLHVTLEPADATLSVDDAPVTLPPSGDIFVEPGEHRCSVTREGYEANQQATQVSKGSSQVLWIKLVSTGSMPLGAASPAAGPAPSVSESAPPKLNEDSGRSLAPAFVGGGLVIAGSAVGAAFLLSANSNQSDADGIKNTLTGENPCGAGTPNGKVCAELHDKNSSVDNARTGEMVGFAVAGAAVVGTVVYLLWPHSSATAATWSPTLGVVRGAGMAGLSGHF